MKKIFSFLLMAAMLLAVGASVTSCEEEDYGYYKVEKALFGEWESDELETNESNGIVWYLLQIAPSDKYSVSPFRLIVKRKDGQLYLYGKGTMGHRNDDPNNRICFSDYYNRDSWNIDVEWIDKDKKHAILYYDRNDKPIVFHKTKDTTEYEEIWKRE